MKNILIVEENQSLSSALRDKLEKENFACVTVIDYVQVFQKLESWIPDLILLDIMLPGQKNGFDILEELKRNKKFQMIPVIVLTNLDSEEKTAMEIGANEYLVKSNVALDEIVKKIKLHL